MTTSTTQQGDALLNVYRPAAPTFVAGEHSYLIAEDGRRYLDFTSGIGVNALGYGDPEFTGAVREVLDTGLIHTSNLYRTKPATELARWLVEQSFADRVFFCNSGAEANEGAFKFARRWAREHGSPEKYEIVAFRGSFHGRTFGALAATDRPAFRDPFEPLMPGVRFCEVGRVEELERVIQSDRTAAVIIEPIQVEGGVLPVPAEFLRDVRELCDREESLLIFDEVQVGLGRTGMLWAHHAAGVEPDIMSIAKPLAGGLPMGAVLLTDRVAQTIQLGDHATTFGGGPLVAAAGLAVCRKIGEPAFLADVHRKGELLAERLGALALRRESVITVRGSGMIWGIEIATLSAEVVDAALDAGLLVCAAGPRVIRVIPPLTTSDDDLIGGLSILEGVL